MIVTGGGRGIGAATARLAAQRGYAVCVNYRNHSAAAGEVVGEIERAGGRAIAVRADISREEEVERLFDEAASKLGALTALVNNAGILTLALGVACIAQESLPFARRCDRAELRLREAWAHWRARRRS